jgi:hypothetical protein
LEIEEYREIFVRKKVKERRSRVYIPTLTQRHAVRDMRRLRHNFKYCGIIGIYDEFDSKF